MPDESRTSDDHAFGFADIRARLHNLAHPSKRPPKSADGPGKSTEGEIKKAVVEAAVDEILKRVGASTIQIVTVRERSGFREERLRHVYASYPEIREWFNNQDQEWFDKRTAKSKDKVAGLESSAFKDPRATRIPSVRLGGLTCHCCLFHIAGKQRKVVREEKSRGKVSAKHIFPDRIDEFLNDNGSSKSLAENVDFDGINACLVFGFTETATKHRIDQMIAVYIGGLPPNDDDLPKGDKLADRICDSAHIAAEMFRTVKEIQTRERLELERRALTDIVGLVPTFAAEDVSPSDAVAALIPKFDTIFKDHGHVGKESYLHASDDDPDEWVTFLSIHYREPNRTAKGESEPATPVLSVYPQIRARENYLQSYRVSRTDTLSISKYLLYTYLESQDIPTPVKFKQRFHKVKKVPDKAFHRINGIPVGLVLTNRDDAWDDREAPLQFNIFSKKTRTTAAFLLRRTTGRDNRPFAILVFESEHPDAFSKDDVELFSRLVDASASLHSEIKVGTDSLDYAALCKEAFTDIVPGDVGNVPYWKIAFELSRFDDLAAQAILGCDEQNAKILWNKLDHLSKKKVREAVLKRYARSLA